MRNTAARGILRQGLARAELGRVQDGIRPRFVAANPPKQAQDVLPPSPTSVTLLPLSSRAFHTTPAAQKGGKTRERDWKDIKGRMREIHKTRQEEMKASYAKEEGGEESKHPPADPGQPLDFGDVESRVRRHEERFRELLKTLKSGGRFNPDVVGALRVQPDRKSLRTFALREVAQVVPRGGRTISILVNEEEYIKPIMSAVQASEDFNQQPQRDPDIELGLILKIEPEKREDLLKRAKALCTDWRDKVRSVRQRRDKTHSTWRKEGQIGPDFKRTADKELEKIIKAAMAVVDAAEKETLKSLETK
ncbi:ribosome recycling factor [Jackrogersella minutella]|nr:ribosome recycling factor [Jackrogersella minutella]